MTHDPDDDMIAVPRWVLGILAEELTMRTQCGGENDQPGCPRCDAIRIAKEASETIDWIKELPTVTRVTVVDSGGLLIENWGVKDVTISMQDDRKTLKVFYKNV